jgi:uncharacterized RDD family membrane protein YckC
MGAQRHDRDVEEDKDHRVARESRVSDDRRAAAFVVDMAILVSILYAIVAIRVSLGVLRPDLVGWDLDPMALILDLPTLIVSAVYFIGCWTRGGRTIGMRLLGLRVSRNDDHGRLTLREASIRWFVLQGAVLMAIWIVDRSGELDLLTTLAQTAWIALLWWTIRTDPSSRGLHDRLSGTRVTRWSVAGDR